MNFPSITSAIPEKGSKGKIPDIRYGNVSVQVLDP